MAVLGADTWQVPEASGYGALVVPSSYTQTKPAGHGTPAIPPQNSPAASDCSGAVGATACFLSWYSLTAVRTEIIPRRIVTARPMLASLLFLKKSLIIFKSNCPIPHGGLEHR